MRRRKRFMKNHGKRLRKRRFKNKVDRFEKKDKCHCPDVKVVVINDSKFISDDDTFKQIAGEDAEAEDIEQGLEKD